MHCCVIMTCRRRKHSQDTTGYTCPQCIPHTSKSAPGPPLPTPLAIQDIWQDTYRGDRHMAQCARKCQQLLNAIRDSMEMRMRYEGTQDWGKLVRCLNTNKHKKARPQSINHAVDSVARGHAGQSPNMSSNLT